MGIKELLKFQAYRYNILMNIHVHILHQILKSNQILVLVVVEVVVGVVDMIDHKLEVVVVEVEVVVFRHMQKLNV